MSTTCVCIGAQANEAQSIIYFPWPCRLACACTCVHTHTPSVYNDRSLSYCIALQSLEWSLDERKAEREQCFRRRFGTSFLVLLWGGGGGQGRLIVLRKCSSTEKLHIFISLTTWVACIVCVLCLLSFPPVLTILSATKVKYESTVFCSNNTNLSYISRSN